VPSHSWTTFLEAKRKELQRLNGAYKNTLKNANVELLEGFGRIVDAHTVDVSGKRYTVRHAALQNGSSFLGTCFARTGLHKCGVLQAISLPGPESSIASLAVLHHVQAKNILIAVGGKPTKLPIPGAEHCITSDEALELPAQPKKITVLGGGYIALEFSGIFQRFGSEVHTVFRQPMPLRGFDEEVRAAAAAAILGACL
jgi:glutathione reductase (NADPH)